jgi:hypothetical protein
VSWATFLRREWGAATFVATVIIGLVAVPLALYFTNQSGGPVALPTPTPTVASGPSVATPASTAATASPSPSQAP